MSEITVLLGKRIRQLRQVRELTQEQLAELADINTNFLGQIERGVKSPTIDTLNKLAAALQISLSEMMSFHTNVLEDSKDRRMQELLKEYADRVRRLYDET